MDQVLVNFLGGARKALGKEFNDPSLGPDSNKWKLLATIPEFWTNLEWMPNANRLWTYIKDYDTYILSACPHPDDHPTCPDEKKEWCRIQLGVSHERVHTVRRSQKKDYAVVTGTPNLLIDDHPKNVLEWELAGGIAILHHTVPETLIALKQLGL